MSLKLEGQNIQEAKELIKMMAASQHQAEVGHYNTVRAIQAYINKKYPDTQLRYPTMANWLNQERNRLLIERLRAGLQE